LRCWLPNEPNDQGGDAYVSGSFNSCLVKGLPDAPTAKLTTTTADFLRGFVREPGRNDALNKAAFELGSKRVERGEATRLCLFGAQLCGLEAEEPEQTRTTITSGYEAGLGAAPAIDPSLNGHVAAADIKFRRLDGIGNGERFIDHHGRDVRYSYELDKWLVWTGRRWSPDAQVAVEAMAKKTARLILTEMERSLEEARDAGKPDDELEAIEKKYRKQYLSAARVTGVRDTLKMAQSEPGVKVSIAQIDANPMLMNVRNGTIDLATGQLHPHRRTDGITKLAPASFDPGANSTLYRERHQSPNH
jgi:hypothetical protein